MNGFDLLLLAFKGITIASIPLALIWVGRAPKSDGDRLRRLAWVTAFLTFDLIVFGGFTRLTDSGLGCPDWPGCYAKANPFQAVEDIRHAEAAMPFGPVTMSKAWIEMIHRYLAMAVGFLIVTMLVLTVRRAWRRRGGAPRVASASAEAPARPILTLGLLGLVALQGAFGAWTVTQKLQPIFVTTHLLLGLALLGLLIWHALALDGRAHGPESPRIAMPRGIRPFAGLALGVLVVQIALGGWVSANYAVLACTDFPSCQGVWFPPMDFSNGFHLWRDLGKTADGGYLTVAALTAIHWVHRSFAGVVFLVLGALAWRVRRIEALARPAVVLAVLLACQFLTGLVNVVFAWPLVAAVLHNAGAAALVATLVVINYRLPRRHRAPLAVDSRRSINASPHPSTAGRSAGQAGGIVPAPPRAVTESTPSSLPF